MTPYQVGGMNSGAGAVTFRVGRNVESPRLEINFLSIWYPLDTISKIMVSFLGFFTVWGSFVSIKCSKGTVKGVSLVIIKS